MSHLAFVLAVGIGLGFFAPLSIHAGVGGTPPPPRAGAEAAGKATDYCCARWIPQNDGSLNGQSCFAINDSPQDRNSCSTGMPPQAAVLSGAVKCRGEVFDAGLTAAAGTIKRCLTP